MKLIIWMNIASHHQSYFFDECYQILANNFRVAYYDKESIQSRKLQGWNGVTQLKEYEFNANSAQEILDYSDYVHIIPGEAHPFTKKLIELSISNNLQWCHWSERSGMRLAQLLKFNTVLYQLISPLFFSIMKRKYANKINRYALGAFAQGDLATKDFRQWGIKANKISALYYSVPALKSTSRMKEVDEFTQERKIFLCCASLYKLKGIDLLIKAFKQLKSDGWCLIFVGKDQTNGRYQALVNKLGLNKEVLFTGVVPIESMANYMNYADVFVLPTRHDGWGVVLNEAASLGKAIISTTECGSAYHLIEEGRNGYRVKTGSIKALRNAMNNYINNPMLIEKHGAFSKELFKEFTPEKNATRLISTIANWL